MSVVDETERELVDHRPPRGSIEDDTPKRVVSGFQVAVDDAALMRGFSRASAIRLGDGQRLIERNRTLSDAVGKRGPFD